MNSLSKLQDWFYQQSVQKQLIYLGLAVVFILVFALNYFFPIYCDDMMYSVVKYGESVNLIENLKEIADFMWMYYFEWGGRVIAHVVTHILLLFPKIGQDVINAFIYCCLTYLAYKLSLGKQKNNIFLFAFIAISFFYFTPSFLSSAIWKTGSANYLWMITLTLAFIYPYFKFYLGKKYTDTTQRTILFLLFGLVAAWTNENLAPVLLLIIACYMLVFYLTDKHIPRWAIAGFVGGVIGCALMIFALGNAVRAELEGYPSLFSSLSVMGDRLPAIYASYKYFMFRPIIIYLVALVFFYYFPRQEIDRSKILMQSLLFLVAANISIWITIFAPSFPPRAFMSITVLTIVSIAILYAHIDLRKTATKVINILFLIGLIFYASIDYMTFLKGSYFLHKQMEVRESKIDEAKAKGESTVEFDAIHLDYRFEYTDFANYYKDYYNIDAKFIEEEDK